MIYIGIDPGASGGIGVATPLGDVAAHKMPDTPHELADLIRSYTLRNSLTKPFAVLERVASFPGQGVSSTFKFGANFGMIQGVLAAVGIPYELVSPGVWQKAMGCLTKGDKNVTKAAAQRMFPGIRVTHAVADALLLAEYARRIHIARYGDKDAAKEC